MNDSKKTELLEACAVTNKKEMDALYDDFNSSVYINGKNEVIIDIKSKIRIQKRINRLVKLADRINNFVGTPI